jgi:hypothetical protein
LKVGLAACAGNGSNSFTKVGGRPTAGARLIRPLRRSRENFPKLHFRTDRNYPLPGAKLPGARSPAATIVNEELTPVHPNLCLLKLQINFSALYQ